VTSAAVSPQLAFNLPHRPALGRDDFLIAPCNRDAVAWIDLWPDWPAPALIIHGPAACGKSHLAAVWARQADAERLPGDILNTHDARAIAQAGRPLVLDHLDPWIGDRHAETVLFHLYNLSKENGRSLLLTLRTPPVRHAFALPDLASRLRAAPAVAIEAPDDTLLASLLAKLFADRQLQVGEDVIAYILPRMERSFWAAQHIVERADALALAEKRAISVPLVRTVLAAMSDAE
jgi:chromosomal replication initiation ATPase DnaA